MLTTYPTTMNTPVIICLSKTAMTTDSVNFIEVIQHNNTKLTEKKVKQN